MAAATNACLCRRLWTLPGLRANFRPLQTVPLPSLRQEDQA
jgi:hypothetical protein